MTREDGGRPIEIILPYFGGRRALTDVPYIIPHSCAVFPGRRTNNRDRIRIVGAPLLTHLPAELPGEVPVVLALNELDIEGLPTTIRASLSAREHVLITGPSIEGRFLARLIHENGSESPVDVLVLGGPLLERFVRHGVHLELAWNGDEGGPLAPEDTWLVPVIGGVQGMRRLQHLRIGVVGCGRAASLVVDQLIRLGCVQRLLLVGDDVEEASDLRAARLSSSVLGLPKVEALRRDVLCHEAGADVIAIAEPAESIPSMEALHDCDVVFTCGDHGRGRVAASVAAKLGAVSLLIDIGTHIRSDTIGSLRCIADVRAIAAGDRRCLVCWGGVRRLDEKRDIDWRSAGLGSHQSVKGVAASQAVFLFREFMAGSFTSSRWTHFAWGPSGALQSSGVFRFGLRNRCPVCDCAERHPREPGMFLGDSGADT